MARVIYILEYKIQITRLSWLSDQTTLTKKSLATLDGEIVDEAITVKLEMLHVLKVHDAQT